MIHEIAPVFDHNSKILILGTFPSVKSREGRFFYHHPQNRFWKVIAAILVCECPETINQKKKMLLDNGIALWDVIASCEINGSSDSSIQNVVPNDLNVILSNANIRQIYVNGSKAYEFYNAYCFPQIGRKVIKLPSTSSANASFSIDELIEKWKILRNDV